MTPKEKAIELYDNFFLLHQSATDENGVWFISVLNKGLAKKCSLKTIDEIIKDNASIYSQKYWQEVKQEIEKI